MINQPTHQQEPKPTAGLDPHPRQAEYIAQQVEPRDRRAEDIVGEEDEEPVFDNTRYVHCQRARLANEHENRLQCQC